MTPPTNMAPDTTTEWASQPIATHTTAHRTRTIGPSNRDDEGAASGLAPSQGASARCAPPEQPSQGAEAPRVTIMLPDSIEPIAVWMRYQLIGAGQRRTPPVTSHVTSGMPD